jgi:hypothetical protein
MYSGMTNNGAKTMTTTTHKAIEGDTASGGAARPEIDLPSCVRLRTPCCGGRAVRAASFMLHGVQVVTRTCPKCKGRWQVVLQPLGAVVVDEDSGFAHRAEWTCIKGAE